jgi:PAS domain S-box-containing protein
MKVTDIMVKVNMSDALSELPGLYQDQDILSLNSADLLPLPPVICVMNRQNEVIGSVEKDSLLFLSHSGEGWVFAQILDKHLEAVIAIDANGYIFYVNDAYYTVLGVPKHKVLGKKMQFIEPGAEMLTVCESGEPIIDKDVQIRSLNRHVVVNIHPIFRDQKLVAVVSIFRDVTETKKLSQALNKAQELAEYFREQIKNNDELSTPSMIGRNPAFLKALSQAKLVAKTDASVLITGENGVGKEVVAKALHANSNRRNKPLICVNCAAIPESLLESELFGYEEGSFTGAKRGGKLGKFELADGGTIFLDEVGDMSGIMQSKILRVLQEKEIEKIGRTQIVPVDVRIIAATNRPLETMIKQGIFRNDLYYRLSVVTIRIPPLRQRGEDIGLLAYYFLQQSNAKYSKTLTLSSAVLHFFYNYEWPGNVRELQNCIEYVSIMCSDDEIYVEHLPLSMLEAKGDIPTATNPNSSGTGSFRDEVQLTEKELILRALKTCHNNRTAAMKTLGVSRRTFYRKLKEFGLME